MKLYSKTMYHGSPHKFEEFDLSFMGTGEGAQGHGWGIYLAENKNIATKYARKYKGDGVNRIVIDGQLCTTPRQVADLVSDEGWSNEYINRMFSNALGNRQIHSWDDFVEVLHFRLSKKIDAWMDMDDDDIRSDILGMEINRMNSMANTSHDVEIRRVTGGNVYTVSVPDDLVLAEEFVRISSQPFEVQEATINWFDYDVSERTFKEVYKSMASESSPDEASMFLKSYGVDGIKYYGNSDLDCMVIFDPKIIEILGTESDV